MKGQFIHSMAKVKYDEALAGGDLRSIGKSNSLVSSIHHQTDFDVLYKCLSHPDRKVVMRTADAIEKITAVHPSYLAKHKSDILEICNKGKLNKELQWHLALFIARLPLEKLELDKAWILLASWATNKLNSRIVRVNSIQGLFELSNYQPSLSRKLEEILNVLEQEKVPSINARIKKLRKQIAIGDLKEVTMK